MSANQMAEKCIVSQRKKSFAQEVGKRLRLTFYSIGFLELSKKILLGLLFFRGFPDSYSLDEKLNFVTEREAKNMFMDLKIGKADLSHLDSINLVLQDSKAYWGYDSDFMARFMDDFAVTEGYLADLNNLVKVAFLNDKIVAFYSFSDKKDEPFELDNFFIHPNFIGKGLGRVLWKSVIETAISFEKKDFIVWSDPNAEGFYAKMGCQKIGTRKSSMIPNRHPPVFRYQLP